MNQRPNLFNYATSELSQDAFIAWLIEWAKQENKKEDEFLNTCAISFVRALLEKGNSFEIEHVEVGRQWNNIDVWALINEKHFIVIEDKKATQEHSDQLKRYAQIAKEHYKDSDIEIHLVYFKMEEQGKYKDVQKAGFSLFKRNHMLSILGQYINNPKASKYNDIVLDYYNYLVNLDEKIKSYLSSPLDKWGWYRWQGFYTELQKHIGGEWGYVPNASRGFVGFWWNFNNVNVDGKGMEYYLQLEQTRLIFKMCANKENERRSLRAFYRERLFKKASELNIEISRFGRLGQYMGVAKLNTEYRKKNKDGFLDLQATIDNLKQVMELINTMDWEVQEAN